MAIKNKENIVIPRELLDKKIIIANFKKQLTQEKNLNVEVPSILQQTVSEKKMLDKQVTKSSLSLETCSVLVRQVLFTLY